MAGRVFRLLLKKDTSLQHALISHHRYGRNMQRTGLNLSKLLFFYIVHLLMGYLDNISFSFVILLSSMIVRK